jgi:hypothetical protein
MSEDQGMNPDQIERVFGALGRIEQKIDGHTSWMEKHVADDRLMANDIVLLKERAARQRGFITALTAMGSVIGAVAGYAVDLVVRGVK